MLPDTIEYWHHVNEGYSVKKWIILKSKEKKRKKYVAQQRIYLTMKEGIRRDCLTMSLLI